jgi:periplasmic protein TonB
MFNTLERAWDQSARRGWTTFASFTMQAFAVSLLLAISLIWVGQPPQVRWLQLSTPASFTPQPQAATQPARGHRATAAVSLPRPEQIIAPPSIPLHPATEIPDPGPSVPSWQPATPGTGGGSDVGAVEGLGSLPVVIPSRPAPVKPLVISHMAEANLLHKVQPVYPPLAREARVQGAVELRAIISKAGTIENLIVVRGHPMLARAALEAVKQWRYRPYLLNNEPVEVETDITVNFLLSGG